jgi:O-antigen ligase
VRQAIFVFERVLLFLLISLFTFINLAQSTLLQLLMAALVLAAIWIIIIVNSKFLLPVLLKMIGLRAHFAVYLVFALMLVICAAYLKGALFDTISWLKAIQMSFIWFSIYLCSLSIFSKRRSVERQQALVLSLLTSINIYVVFNVVSFALGFRALNSAYIETGTGKATILSLMGISTERVLFPFALGVNGFGVIAGAAVVIAFILFQRTRKWLRFLYLGYLVCALIGVLATDSRGAMVFALLAIILISFSHRSWLKHWRILVIFTPIFPFLIMAISKLIGATLSLAKLSRGTTILSFREIIWANVFAYLKANAGFNLLWGYGYLGQVTSKAYQVYYSLLFSHLNVESPERASVHNFMLQNLLDIGLLGISLILIVLFILISRTTRTIETSGIYKAVLGFVLFLVFAGTTDLTLNVYNFHLFMPFLVFAVYFSSRTFETVKPVRALKPHKQLVLSET